jgi:hypothetical protein
MNRGAELENQGRKKAPVRPGLVKIGVLFGSIFLQLAIHDFDLIAHGNGWGFLL